ncbi:hypothetical protein ACYCAX_25500 [Pseudomonas sp. MT3]|uniref:hypothetical protein n=1 Tax=Pseudomonas sp. ATCC 13867 TaxID=1294143 RepID=UPI0002C4DD1E|nr:hypothetical protein [Pseudomonas sp. ATCC 13867]AGI25339.1 hypothetical protein H681_17355 [Pseudomonas sp. ATCC 13867]RFQ25595.1 hypothetical protein D0N87_20725 [Pseudomonas sp. ATCC 13867]
MPGVVLVVLGVLWLVVQCGVGLLPLADAISLEPVSQPERFWQFAFLGPSIPLALGVFLLRYRVRRFVELKHESVNCAAYLLVCAGTALVLGKLCALLIG